MDCYSIGRTIPAEDTVGMLFETDVMNKSVLMKRYEPSLPTARRRVNVSTVVYFPYDFDNVYDGGESLSFNDYDFHKALSFKIAKGDTATELQERIDADMKMMNLVDSMHSLDSFLFKSKAEQRGVDTSIHQLYSAITLEEWEEIRLPIREKISKLVSKALGSISGKENGVGTQFIELFLTKIWEAKDVDGIEPFIKAMQIEPKRAPDAFFAWKAVCYYQVRFAEVVKPLKTLSQWVGHNELCYPVDGDNLSAEMQKQIKERRAMLRQKMQKDYFDALNVLTVYEHSYNQFVDHDQPQTFMQFLKNSENSYLQLANHVSVATHSVNLWKWYVEQFGARLRSAQFLELFDGLTYFYGTDE